MAIAMTAETFSGNLFSITLLPHFHPPSAFPYPSAFALRWKQAEKLEAHFASTLPPTSCIPLSIGICPVVEAIRKGGSKFSFHLSETPEFCSNNLFTSIILRKSYINQSVRHSAEAMKSTGRVSRSSG